MQSHRSLPAVHVTEFKGMPVAYSRPIRLRYEVDWDGPHGSKPPVIAYFFRDRYLCTWKCDATDILSGRLDAFFSRPLWLRLTLWTWRDDCWFGVFHVFVKPGGAFEYLGPLKTRILRPYGADEAAASVRDCLVSRLYGRPDVAVERLITSLDDERRRGGN